MSRIADTNGAPATPNTTTQAEGRTSASSSGLNFPPASHLRRHNQKVAQQMFEQGVEKFLEDF